MDSIFAFVAGLVARLGLILFIPLLCVVALAVVAVAMRVLGRAPGAQDEKAGWLAFDPLAAYSPGHTWLREAGVRLRVGLDDLALRLLPQISAVTVPDAGFSIAAGETLAVLRIGEHEVQILAPVAGKVVARNSNVQDSASLRGEGGWFVSSSPAARRISPCARARPRAAGSSRSPAG